MNRIFHNRLYGFATPYKLPKIVGNCIKFKFKFDEYSRYTVRDAKNYGDINKMIGIKTGLFSQEKDGVMCGWRYLSEENRFEIFLYVHGADVESGKKVGSGNAVITLDSFEAKINVEYYGYLIINQDHCELLIFDKNMEIRKRLSLNRQSKLSNKNFLIWSWMGGQESYNISYCLEHI